MNYFIMNKFVKRERPMMPVLDEIKGPEKIFSGPWGSVVLGICRSEKFLEESTDRLGQITVSRRAGENGLSCGSSLGGGVGRLENWYL